MSMTVTEFPQLAHTESSSTNRVCTGSEPKLTHLHESGSHRSSGEEKDKNVTQFNAPKTQLRTSWGCKKGNSENTGYYRGRHKSSAQV